MVLCPTIYTATAIYYQSDIYNSLTIFNIKFLDAGFGACIFGAHCQTLAGWTVNFVGETIKNYIKWKQQISSRISLLC